MLAITDTINIPDHEFAWKFARSGGPGGQNVNKVESKALLIWQVGESQAIREDVKRRLAQQQKRFFTGDGNLLITSQRFRDQDRNRQDCLEKLRAMIVQALHVPKPRKKTKPTRGSRQRRLEAKRRRSTVRSARRIPQED